MFVLQKQMFGKKQYKVVDNFSKKELVRSYLRIQKKPTVGLRIVTWTKNGPTAVTYNVKEF